MPPTTDLSSPPSSRESIPGRLSAPTVLKRLAIVALCASLAVTAGLAGSPDDDWLAVTSLDAGPKVQGETPDGVRAIVLRHLAAQDRALRAFLTAHPEDSRAFEANLRLARLLQIRTDFEQNEKLRAESKRILDHLEKAAPEEMRPELEFAKLAQCMRTVQKGDVRQRDDLLKAARNFQRAYPNDRRIAALLAEVATLFDSQPAVKEALLEDAQAAAKEPEIKGRISDDLKRVRLLGKSVPLRFTSIQGEEFDIDRAAGRPVLLCFFAQFSPPAMSAVAQWQQYLKEMPAGSVQPVGICLDAKRESALEALRAAGINWPVAWDGKGWQSPVVRGFGINALPTIWLIDRHGRLRSLNATEAGLGQLKTLLTEP